MKKKIKNNSLTKPVTIKQKTIYAPMVRQWFMSQTPLKNNKFPRIKICSISVSLQDNLMEYLYRFEIETKIKISIYLSREREKSFMYL